MRIDKDLPKMDQWVCRAHGKYLLEVERNVLGSVLAPFYGYHIVQLGGPTHDYFLQNSLIRHKVRIGLDHSGSFLGNNVCGDATQLPFLPDSVDVMVLPHVLEYVAAPHAVLQQCFDAMAPEGHIVVLGFNPFSLWGLAKWLGPNDCVFRRAQFVAPYQLRGWLKQAGFEIVEYKSMCFRWPAGDAKWFERFRFLEPLGRYLTPSLGGIYLIVAQKRLLPMNLVGVEPMAGRVKVRPVAPEPTLTRGKELLDYES